MAVCHNGRLLTRDQNDGLSARCCNAREVLENVTIWRKANHLAHGCFVCIGEQYTAKNIFIQQNICVSPAGLLRLSRPRRAIERTSGKSASDDTTAVWSSLFVSQAPRVAWPQEELGLHSTVPTQSLAIIDDGLPYTNTRARIISNNGKQR